MVVLGGSRGARSINELAVEAFGAVGPAVLHLSGERDYPSLLRPAMRCVAKGGRLAATCHVPSMSKDELERVVRRSAEKEERTIAHLAMLTPEADFPSPDGQPPLKIAVATLA